MRGTRLLAPLAAVATLLSVAAAAQAAPVSLSADDPADGVGGPSRDIAQVRTTFDPDAGRWTVTVRLQAPASSDAWAMVNATLWAPGTSSASCTGGATNFASFRASTNPGSTGAYGSAGARAR